jgi:hypothetical protein
MSTAEWWKCGDRDYKFGGINNITYFTCSEDAESAADEQGWG